MAMPTVGSVATAAMPTPKRPAARSATKIMMQMETTGMTTERMPVESPAMMTVDEPVSPALAISRTGLPAVKYSVDRTKEITPRAPIRTAYHTPVSMPVYLMRPSDRTMNPMAAEMVPMRSATSGLLPEEARTRRMEPMEHSRPSDDSSRGRPMMAEPPPRPTTKLPSACCTSTVAMATVAIMAPQ